MATPRRRIVALTLLSGLMFSVGLALWLGRDSIARARSLRALRTGDAAACRAAIAQLYGAVPMEADRLLVRLLMAEDHENHAAVIEALTAAGRLEIVPIPPRTRYERTRLTSPDAAARRAAARYLLLTGNPPLALADGLPHLTLAASPDPDAATPDDRALYPELAARRPRLDQELLALARAASPAIATQALVLLAQRSPGDPDRGAAAGDVLALLERPGLGRAEVLAAATTCAPILDGAALARLLPTLAGANAREGAALLARALPGLLAAPETAAALRAFAADVTASPAARVRLLTALPDAIDARWLPAVLSCATAEDEALARAAVATLGQQPAAVLETLSAARHAALAGRLATLLTRPPGRPALLGTTARLAASRLGQGCYGALLPLVIALAREPGDGAQALSLLPLLVGRPDDEGADARAAQLIELASSGALPAVIRVTALEALAGWDARLPLAPLLGILKAVETPAAVRAAVLERVVDRPEPALGPLLERALGDGDARVVGWAARALARRGGEGLEARLLAELQRRPTLIAALIPSLARTGGPAARARIRAALDDASPAVRQAAVRALGLLREEAAIPRLMAIFEDADAPAAVRAEAGRVLATLVADDSLPAFLAALRRSADPLQVLPLAGRLAARGQRGVAPLLVDLLAHPALPVRQAAHRLLRRLAGDVRHGYAADGEDAARTAAVERWRAWATAK